MYLWLGFGGNKQGRKVVENILKAFGETKKTRLLDSFDFAHDVSSLDALNVSCNTDECELSLETLF